MDVIKKVIKGVNSKMIETITGRTIHEETTKDNNTYDAVSDIRTTRLKWIGFILSMVSKHMVHIVVNKLYNNRLDGYLLVDAPT